MEAGDFVTGCFADFIEDPRLCPYSFAYEKNKQFRNNGQSAKIGSNLRYGRGIQLTDHFYIIEIPHQIGNRININGKSAP